MLRKSAEKTMQALVWTVFSRLKSIPLEEEPFEAEAASAAPPTEETLSISTPDPTSKLMRSPSSTPPLSPDEKPKAQEDKPYGLPAIKELLRVLISLLDPYDNTHTDSMRSLALTILQTAFEIGGVSISRFRSLKVMVSDGLCKHVFELIRAHIGDGSGGSSTILAACLRFIATVFDTMRAGLRLQLELYLSFLLDRLSVGRKDLEAEQDQQTWDADLALPETASLSSAPGSQPPRTDTASPAPFQPKREVLTFETRVLLLEQFCLLFQDPSTGPTLWLNYDTRVESEDLLERSLCFLARGVFLGFHSAVPGAQASKSSATDAVQAMCLDTLLAFVKGIADREPTASAVDREAAVALGRQKASKRLLLQGAGLFNAKPKKGLSFLEENGFIYSPESTAPREAQLAVFLKESVRLDKREMGDYISRPENVELLKQFMKLFNFTDVRARRVVERMLTSPCRNSSRTPCGSCSSPSACRARRSRSPASPRSLPRRTTRPRTRPRI
jgi:brefeldin A-resistance guanine nucleotide exchange factor 1